jgi:hypothetical protein
MDSDFCFLLLSIPVKRDSPRLFILRTEFQTNTKRGHLYSVDGANTVRNLLNPIHQVMLNLIQVENRREAQVSGLRVGLWRLEYYCTPLFRVLTGPLKPPLI